jgi:hypothetical protein
LPALFCSQDYHKSSPIFTISTNLRSASRKYKLNPRKQGVALRRDFFRTSQSHDNCQSDISPNTRHVSHKTMRPEEKNSKALTHTPSMTKKKSGVELEMKAKKKKVSRIIE